MTETRRARRGARARTLIEDSPERERIAFDTRPASLSAPSRRNTQGRPRPKPPIPGPQLPRWFLAHLGRSASPISIRLSSGASIPKRGGCGGAPYHLCDMPARSHDGEAHQGAQRSEVRHARGGDSPSEGTAAIPRQASRRPARPRPRRQTKGVWVWLPSRPSRAYHLAGKRPLDLLPAGRRKPPQPSPPLSRMRKSPHSI
jgi:hypothetical protein